MKYQKHEQAWPECFDSEGNYRQWLSLARASHQAGDYCSDCTPQYQKLMIEENRCRWPKVHFRRVDGVITGIRGPRSKV